jgi:hypothetical protein
MTFLWLLKFAIITWLLQSADTKNVIIEKKKEIYLFAQAADAAGEYITHFNPVFSPLSSFALCTERYKARGVGRAERYNLPHALTNFL